jgi:hypothetical protein
MEFACEPGPSSSSFYEERKCAVCLSGLVYDERAGWVACETCSGTGRAHAFVYPRRSQQRLQECAGCGGRFSEASRELVEVTEDHESLTWFPGDRPCRRGCAGAHGVL